MELVLRGVEEGKPAKGLDAEGEGGPLGVTKPGNDALGGECWRVSHHCMGRAGGEGAGVEAGRPAGEAGSHPSTR